MARMTSPLPSQATVLANATRKPARQERLRSELLLFTFLLLVRSPPQAALEAFWLGAVGGSVETGVEFDGQALRT